MGMRPETNEPLAQTFSRLANHLEGKAAWARKRADAHAAGDAGEHRLREAVAPLVEAGWVALHNRARPHGGNIDHILIGPSGIYVLDAKAWTGPVTIDGNVIRSNGHNCSRDLRAVSDQTAEVRAATRAWGYSGEVAAGLVLTGKDPGPRKPVRLGEVTVCGVGGLCESLARRRTAVTVVEAQELSRRLAETFPLMNAGTAPSAATVLPHLGGIPEPSDAFLRTSVWLYLEEWKKAGRRRLYLTNSEGSALGWKNLVDGTIAVTADGEERLTRAVLRPATASGLNLARESVPRLPVDMPGGVIISAVTRIYKTIHVARHWRKGSADRLYGTAADPTDGVYDLGYVDLVAGSVHPTQVRLPKDWASAEQRLMWIARRRPPGA